MHPSRGKLLACVLALLGASAATEPDHRQVGELIYEGIPVADPDDAALLALYLEDHATQLMDWAQDGALLLRRRVGETRQLFRLDQPLGEPRPLTDDAQSITAAYASPVSDDLLLMVDEDGTEAYRLVHLAPDGTRTPLTPAGTRAQNVVWAPDGERFAFASNLDDGASTDVFLADLSGPESVRMLFKGGGAWFPLDWDEDGERLLVQEYISITESRLFVVEVDEDGDDHGFSRVDMRVADTVPIADADFDDTGRGLFISADLGFGYLGLYRYHLESRRFESLGNEFAGRGSVVAQAVSGDGRYLAYLVIEEGISRIRALDLRRRSSAGRPGRTLPNILLPEGRISAFGFQPDSAVLAVSLSTSAQPEDVWVTDLARYTVERWTDAGLSGRELAAEAVRYPTFDRAGASYRRVPAFVYRPPGPGPHPVVVFLHGGPESQFVPGYDGFFHYLVEALGVAVVAPNVRGSSGYGRDYLELDDGRRREDAVRDVGALLDWLSAVDDLDQERVIVWGGSYGGYLSLASLMHYSDRLLGGIDVVGISNFVTFLEETSEYRRDLRRREYGDERDPEMRDFLESISPANNAQRITRPVLIVQGANDPRVPQSESEQMVAEIRANGGEVWYLLALDEGHGFERQTNIEAYHLTMAQFITELLRRERGTRAPD